MSPLRPITSLKSKWLATTILTVTLLPPCSSSSAQNRRSSTSEERSKAVQLIHYLEFNPNGRDADRNRGWLAEWLRKIDDVNIPWCVDLSQAGEPKPKAAKELNFQIAMSMLGFVLEHPNEAADPEVRMRAGIAGMLQAYASGLRSPRNNKPNFVDLLSEKNLTGELASYTRNVMSRCSDVPLSDERQRSYKSGDIVYASIEVSKPARIKQLGRPRLAGMSVQTRGTCILHVVLASTGKVTDVEIIRGTPLANTSCVEAAKETTFDPALKNGHPVSTLVRISYTINQ